MSGATHTYVMMDISAAAFEEIKRKLLAAGYDHAIIPSFREDKEALDMHGIGLQIEEQRPIAEGYLEVGRDERGQVVVNHPDLKPDANGVGHIVFSPEQARNFAALLLKHAGSEPPAEAEADAETDPEQFAELAHEIAVTNSIALLGSNSIGVVDEGVEWWDLGDFEDGDLEPELSYLEKCGRLIRHSGQPNWIRIIEVSA